ncbi:hypothetical protein K438DRAFT_1759848 [Mycena galopus ATCC 62051]|nr:hypothetical protein K438DRAFT_1759848 [Mycena galopus ATCC 62051]
MRCGVATAGLVAPSGMFSLCSVHDSHLVSHAASSLGVSNMLHNSAQSSAGHGGSVIVSFARLDWGYTGIVVRWMKMKKNKLFDVIPLATSGAIKCGSHSAPHAVRATGWLLVALVAHRNLSITVAHIVRLRANSQSSFEKQKSEDAGNKGNLLEEKSVPRIFGERAAHGSAVKSRGGFKIRIWIQPQACSTESGRVRASAMIVISVAPSIQCLTSTNGEKPGRKWGRRARLKRKEESWRKGQRR